MQDLEYAFLKRRIRELLAIDLDQYQGRQMRRRLEAFVSRWEDGNAARFCKALEREPRLLGQLADMLTINVSEFFRDTTQFEILKREILPALLRRCRRLNIWTAGCSHGAEPYSIALLLDELGHGNGHRILATDIDAEVLRRGMTGGPYLPGEVKNVSKQRLLEYFRPCDGGYMIGERLRGAVEFRRHNLLSDRFEEGFDLVACRNVIIYFTLEAKRDLFSRFYASLKPGGALFLGGTESLLGIDASDFQKMDGNFYRREERSLARVVRGRAA